MHNAQFGNTALHEAAWNGNKDIVKALLGGFCFVDSINHTGFTSLHLASQNGHAKVVRTLLKWRADPSLLNQVIISCIVLVGLDIELMPADLNRSVVLNT